jgi:hypothetical protein
MEREVIPLISNEEVYPIYEAIEESSTKRVRFGD